MSLMSVYGWKYLTIDNSNWQILKSNPVANFYSFTYHLADCLGHPSGRINFELATLAGRHWRLAAGRRALVKPPVIGGAPLSR